MTHTPDPQVVLEGTFDQAHEKRYAHLPFEVPPGVRALRVRYDYTDRIPADPAVGGGNTLDIGLFDPRGIAPSSPGFRGWSGSAKHEFVVAETWATPPYTPGPIQPGTWHVLLGPYKIGPRGCAYRVEITLAAEEGPPSFASREIVSPPLPRERGPGGEGAWLRGDLHCHTLHSDGDSWPADMLARAVQTGLDFLGVTDHNTTAHHADYARVAGERLPIILPGVEVTTYGGHWNAWGTDTWWEFRESDTDAVSRTMQAAAASGALVSVNHPKPFGPEWRYPDARGYHAIEVWNGEWPRLNTISLAWWEQQLRAGKRVVALGGSDTHHLRTPDPDARHAPHLGCPTTWAYVGQDRTAAGVLAALRAGHVFISRGPEGPQLYLRCGDLLPGDTLAPGAPRHLELHVVGADRATLVLLSARGAEMSAVVEGSDWYTTVPVPEEARLYLRAQLLDPTGSLLALSNPLYL